ncbi:alpha/beta fold hydrolase [Psychrobacter alimentarius]|uniref:alpha/beta fold hydrolase n=1 Tax=Psychrobacter alimentarius TaxID=261164 RepID=UPI00191B57E9|nr:alpha/beta hydrolase [Psychrobacter alimentarius]
MQPFERTITLDDKQARYYDLSTLGNRDKNTSRTAAHFYGGNGFTTGVYLPLLTELSAQFAITSLAMRGYWHDLPSIKKLTREEDADILIDFLEKTQDSPIVGIGHSQGATATAIAAAKRPDLFSELYLIEPVTFTKSQTLMMNAAPDDLKIGQEPFKSTLAKQADWDSIESYYEYLRAHRAFKRINDEHLYTFAKNSLVQNEQERYSLLFAPEQELASYFDTPFVNDALKELNDLDVPYTIIVGKPSMFISTDVRKVWERLVPSERIIELSDNGHLLPMEAPQLCADIIMQKFD